MSSHSYPPLWPCGPVALWPCGQLPQIPVQVVFVFIRQDHFSPNAPDLSFSNESEKTNFLDLNYSFL